MQEHEGQLRQLRRGRLHHRVVLAQLILLIIIKGGSVHGVPCALAIGFVDFDLNLLPSYPGRLQNIAEHPVHQSYLPG